MPDTSADPTGTLPRSLSPEEAKDRAERIIQMIYARAPRSVRVSLDQLCVGLTLDITQALTDAFHEGYVNGVTNLGLRLDETLKRAK